MSYYKAIQIFDDIHNHVTYKSDPVAFNLANGLRQFAEAVRSDVESLRTEIAALRREVAQLQ